MKPGLSPSELARELVQRAGLLDAECESYERAGKTTIEHANIPALRTIERLLRQAAEALAPSSDTGPSLGRGLDPDGVRLIEHMVHRFLAWRLPEDFTPDGGISFTRDFNEHTAYPMKHEPVGTNLFTATQAEAMVKHMLGDPEGERRPPLCAALCVKVVGEYAKCGLPQGHAGKHAVMETGIVERMINDGSIGTGHDHNEAAALPRSPEHEKKDTR